MRNYKRKTDRCIDYDKLVVAVKLMKIENKSLRLASKESGIPRTSLCRYVRLLDEKLPDISGIDDDVLKQELQSVTTHAKKKRVQY